MIKNTFGRTGFSVSKICMGTLTIGPLQANLTTKEAVGLLTYAWDRGINFFDTAELYRTHDMIGALPNHIRHDAIIVTKSYAHTSQAMQESVENALRQMKLDVIPIFLLHEQETAMTMKGHRPALDTLLAYKNKGLIKVVGVSTHTIEVTSLVRRMPEIEVLFSMFNIEGWGIKDGTQKEMEQELEYAYKVGKGVYLMKVLAGGRLLGRAKEAINYAFQFPYAHSASIGMKHPDEIDYNIELMEGKEPTVPIEQVPRKMLISFWCEACGACISACPQEAISVVDGKATIDENKCVVCTYCTGFCPLNCLRVV